MAEVWYNKPGLNRSQRRRIEAQADDVERITQADRRFFERFPARSHRVRLLSRPELNQLAIATGHDVMPPVGQKWVAVIRQIDRGARMRRFAKVQGEIDLDLPESACAALWQELNANSEYSRQVEATLRTAVARGAT